MSNLWDTEKILRIFQNARDKYYQFLFFLILSIIITFVFWCIYWSPRIWICLWFILIWWIFLIFYKNNKENNYQNTDEQIKIVEAYTKLHQEIWDTDKTNEIFKWLFPSTWERLTNWRIQIKPNETETDKIL